MKIKRLDDKAIVPTRGSAEAAGWDLYACLDKNEIIFPRETLLIDTGWSMEIPKNYFGAIYPRSGLAVKYGLRLANGTGIIDSDYRGPVKVALHNDSLNNYVIKHGDRIAQLIIIPYESIEMEEVEELEDTDRGTGGFGSTGK